MTRSTLPEPLRGFTMIELVIAIVVSATVLTLALPWVLNLISISSANLDAEGPARTSATIARALDTDFLNATPCPANGSALHMANATSLALFTSTGPDGTRDNDAHLVVWTLQNGTLARAATPATLTSTSCAATDPTKDPLTNPSAPQATFTTHAVRGPALGSGLQAFSDTDTGTPRLITVNLAIASPDTPAAHAPLTATYTLTKYATGLS